MPAPRVALRPATRADLPAVLALLADEGRVVDPADVVVDAAYERAFASIEADSRNELLVLVEEPGGEPGGEPDEVSLGEPDREAGAPASGRGGAGGEGGEGGGRTVGEPVDGLLGGRGTVLGCLQVTYIPGLGRQGVERALVEAVRIRADRRGDGLGRILMERTVARARARGCGLVQLTSNKHRTDTHRFYASLGFEPSHDGFKLPL